MLVVSVVINHVTHCYRPVIHACSNDDESAKLLVEEQLQLLAGIRLMKSDTPTVCLPFNKLQHVCHHDLPCNVPRAQHHGMK